MSNTQTCKNCRKFLSKECPKAPYKRRTNNKAYNPPTAEPCEEFTPKKKEEKSRESQADMLVKLVLENAGELFHDDRKVPYLQLHSSHALKTLRLRSREIKSWMAGLLWKAYEKAPNQEALGSAINVLEAQCQEGSLHKLYNRVAPSEDDSIWVDMCDEKWRAIHVTKEGWKIVDRPPILFRRYSHQKPMLDPVRGGDVDELLEFANIKNDGDKLLYIVTAVIHLIPDIPHVILILFGPQGSGKTWALRVLRALVDPSQLGLLNLPRRSRELVQSLDHNWCSFYDNVGRVPESSSNIFCRAVTGMGVSKRTLYTDDEDTIYRYHRCIGLTDINIAAERGDMLQRSLLLGLHAIPKKRRKTERAMKAAFKKVGPRILGAMLDVLVKAIRIYPSIKLEGLHRMADYGTWACSVTEALGRDKREFLDAYEENVVNQNLEMVRASPISDALIKLMEDNPLGWEGTASQLFSALEEKAKELKISTRQKAWPKKPHVLSRRLNELAPSLPAIGYEITRGYKGKTLLIRINRCGSYGTAGDAVATVASEGIFESFTGHVKELTKLTTVTHEECAICKKRGPMDWCVTKHNDEWGFLCTDCGSNVEKSLNAPKGLGDISNSVTEPKSIDEMFPSQKDSKPTLGELEKVLRDNWQKGTTEQFIELIHQNSDYDRVQAGEYLARLIEEGKMSYDPEDHLAWVR